MYWIANLDLQGSVVALSFRHVLRQDTSFHSHICLWNSVYHLDILNNHRNLHVPYLIVHLLKFNYFFLWIYKQFPCSNSHSGFAQNYIDWQSNNNSFPYLDNILIIIISQFHHRPTSLQIFIIIYQIIETIII